MGTHLDAGVVKSFAADRPGDIGDGTQGRPSGMSRCRTIYGPCCIIKAVAAAYLTWADLPRKQFRSAG
jgi:hypothetical protein